MDATLSFQDPALSFGPYLAAPARGLYLSPGAHTIYPGPNFAPQVMIVPEEQSYLNKVTSVMRKSESDIFSNSLQIIRHSLNSLDNFFEKEANYEANKKSQGLELIKSISLLVGGLDPGEQKLAYKAIQKMKDCLFNSSFPSAKSMEDSLAVLERLSEFTKTALIEESQKQVIFKILNNLKFLVKRRDSFAKGRRYLVLSFIEMLINHFKSASSLEEKEKEKGCEIIKEFLKFMTDYMDKERENERLGICLLHNLKQDFFEPKSIGLIPSNPEAKTISLPIESNNGQVRNLQPTANSKPLDSPIEKLLELIDCKPCFTEERRLYVSLFLSSFTNSLTALDTRKYHLDLSRQVAFNTIFQENLGRLAEVVSDQKQLIHYQFVKLSAFTLIDVRGITLTTIISEEIMRALKV